MDRPAFSLLPFTSTIASTSSSTSSAEQEKAREISAAMSRTNSSAMGSSFSLSSSTSSTSSSSGAYHDNSGGSSRASSVGYRTTPSSPTPPPYSPPLLFSSHANTDEKRASLRALLRSYPARCLALLSITLVALVLATCRHARDADGNHTLTTASLASNGRIPLQQQQSARKGEKLVRIRAATEPFTGYRARGDVWSQDHFLPFLANASAHPKYALTPAKQVAPVPSSLIDTAKQSAKQLSQNLQLHFGYGVEESPSSPPADHVVPAYPSNVSLAGLPYPVAASDIVFSFATDFKRALDVYELWGHFLRHGSYFMVTLPPEQSEKVSDLQAILDGTPRLAGRGHVTTQQMRKYPRYEHRVLNAPRAVLHHDWKDQEGNEKEFKWLVVLDDDTMFLDLKTLMREMGTRDLAHPNMLCGVSEAKNHVNHFGRMCFGGAGMAMNNAMARAVAAHMEECLEKFGKKFGGDDMLTYCAAYSTKVDVQSAFEDVPGLHQFDMFDDVSGTMQSGSPFISLHHWVGWVNLIPDWLSEGWFDDLILLQQVSDLLGGDNMFRRYIFDEGSTLLTLGYSLTFFSEHQSPADFSFIENTDRNGNHRWPTKGRIAEKAFPGSPEYGRQGKTKETYYISAVDVESGEMTYTNQRRQNVTVVWEWDQPPVEAKGFKTWIGEKASRYID